MIYKKLLNVISSFSYDWAINLASLIILANYFPTFYFCVDYDKYFSINFLSSSLSLGYLALAFWI